MTDKLKIYAYNVLFGDAILLEVPEGGDRPRWVLIDVGNVLRGEGGGDQALVDAVRDIHQRTGGRVDLYVMTHEHMDHVQGLLVAQQQGVTLRANRVWMTASAHPDYYDTHPKAREKKRTLEEGLRAFETLLGADESLGLASLLAINANKTAECVDHLRGIGDRPPHYVHRESALDGLHPFAETTIRILAPEEDTSVYYAASRPRLAAAPVAGGAAAGTARPAPLPGVDAGAFYDLVEQMDRGFADTAFQIDQAANNTSLVFELTWRGRKLLFVGDAEKKSWRKMAERPGLLQPVDFLKIGHHGSHNATPDPAVLDLFLPEERRAQAVALVSTCADVYGGVPDPDTLAELDRRVRRIYSTADVPPGQPLVIEIAPGV
jgi:beta-lactamase superfamily II metal-dependent hydrolase